MNKILFVISIFLFSLNSFSQEKKVSFHYENMAFKTVIKDMEKAFNVTISYKSDLIKKFTVNLPKKKYSLVDLFFELEYSYLYKFNKIDEKFYYLTLKETVKLNHILIKGYLTKGIVKTNQANYTINPNAFGILAGLTETDILESIQQLPGVLSINETATELNVRGGSTDQNNIIWDGIPIYHSGHLFGMVSVFNPNVASEIQFYNKGTNAKFSERISSVIDIRTSNKIANKTKMKAGINGISFDGFLEFPIIKNKLSLQASYRSSYEDVLETMTFKAYEEKAFENTKIIDEIFNFKDYNIKLNYKLNSKNSLFFSHIYIDNDLENELLENNNTELHNDILDSENDGYSFQWKYKINTNLKFKANLSYSHYRSFYSDIKNENNLKISEYSKTNNIKNKFLNTHLFWKVSKKTKLDFGYQTSLKKVDYLIKEQKDILYILDKNTATINTHSLFSNYHFKNKGWDIYSGLRFNYYKNLDALRVEPRVVVTKKLNDFLKLQVTGEVKNQIISQINESVLSDLSLDRKIWRLADGGLYPILNGKQITGSAILNYGKWSSDIDFYYKKNTGLTSLTLGYLNSNDNNFHNGIQKINGFDFYLKRNSNHFKNYLSYSYIEMKSKFDGVNNNSYFTANNEIHHALSIVSNYHTKKLDLVLGWKFRSGKPITDINYDNNGNAYFNEINDMYLKNYHRLDFSATYTFSLSKKNNIHSKIGLSFRNIYNNKNHIGTQYIGGNSLNDPFEIIKTHAIGFTPNLSYRVYW